MLAFGQVVVDHRHPYPQLTALGNLDVFTRDVRLPLRTVKVFEVARVVGRSALVVRFAANRGSAIDQLQLDLLAFCTLDHKAAVIRAFIDGTATDDQLTVIVEHRRRHARRYRPAWGHRGQRASGIGRVGGYPDRARPVILDGGRPGHRYPAALPHGQRELLTVVRDAIVHHRRTHQHLAVSGHGHLVTCVVFRPGLAAVRGIFQIGRTAVSAEVRAAAISRARRQCQRDFRVRRGLHVKHRIVGRFIDRRAAHRQVIVLGLVGRIALVRVLDQPAIRVVRVDHPHIARTVILDRRRTDHRFATTLGDDQIEGLAIVRHIVINDGRTHQYPAIRGHGDLIARARGIAVPGLAVVSGIRQVGRAAAAAIVKSCAAAGGRAVPQFQGDLGAWRSLHIEHCIVGRFIDRQVIVTGHIARSIWICRRFIASGRVKNIARAIVLDRGRAFALVVGNGLIAAIHRRSDQFELFAVVRHIVIGNGRAHQQLAITVGSHLGANGIGHPIRTVKVFQPGACGSAKVRAATSGGVGDLLQAQLHTGARQHRHLEHRVA